MKKVFYEDASSKYAVSPTYNYKFTKRTGFFMRWGSTPDEDPEYAPYGPEILDIEITTKCYGVSGSLCAYCYKSNTPSGTNMSFETFRDILDKVNQYGQLTQLAFGLGSTAEENPDLWLMCEYARSTSVIPNGTVADITEATADKIVAYFGACAVSLHDREVGYSSIERLTSRGMKQVNIHQVIYKENIDSVKKTMHDLAESPRLQGVNALVLLSLKPTGRASCGMTVLSQDEFKTAKTYSRKLDIRLGFDSCSATKFLRYLDTHPELEHMRHFVEPCESGLFSSYVDVHGRFHPCSFCEHTHGVYSVDLGTITDFHREVWNHEATKLFRENLIRGGRSCPIYEV